ncbi:glycoside hydrolase family 172 protein [Pseudonocardia lacus]|uniref:glycoside hydrolase family 172 protein n=1 Tax=Pseudonocardia lacus TaxID=2835865 RepID=UPI001BDBD05A|nr:glycoside hydrolase family 172 protein [Pseudonocardia lacus]
MPVPDPSRRRPGVATRSISPENPTGARGRGGRATGGTGAAAGRELGRGWKVSPSIEIAAGATAVLADVAGPGRITHVWLTTHPDHWRSLLLRAHWDGDPEPAVEVPVGDFFGQGWGRFAQLSSAMVAVNPHGGMNSYWPMPFRAGARLSCENLSDRPAILYFQITYDEGGDAAGDDCGYLHAQWRRSNPVDGGLHALLDGVRGAGQYVGTYLAWGVNSRGWWGEGEVKFYLDGDEEFPTICGTGTEDYVGGAWNFDVPGQGYTPYSTPYLGLHQVIRPDGLYESQQRFGLYRWHVPDPIRFATDLRVDVQALGWRSGGRYLRRHDDVASTALFYLDTTSAARPRTPTPDELEAL